MWVLSLCVAGIATEAIMLTSDPLPILPRSFMLYLKQPLSGNSGVCTGGESDASQALFNFYSKHKQA